MKYILMINIFLMHSLSYAGDNNYSFNESPSDYLFKDRGKRVDDDFYDYSAGSGLKGVHFQRFSVPMVQ